MAKTTKKKTTKKKRTMSPAARARIAAAQKARWARIRAGQGMGPAKRGRPVGSSKRAIAGSIMIDAMSIEDMVSTKAAIEKRLREMKKLLSTAGVK